MRRRRYLLAVGAGAVAGCVRAPRRREEPSWTTGEVDLPVSRADLVRAAPKNSIPAIVDPVFDDDWSGLELQVSDPHAGMTTTITPRLADDDAVIGVVREGQARAYPIRLLNWHEVANVGPLLVTYCPLCGSAVVAKRRVEDERRVFGVSGLLWRSNLVLFDRRTESLWSQQLARAIRGPATGRRLDVVPATTTTWANWRRDHPGTSVLLPPPHSNTVVGETTRNYTLDPYTMYRDATGIVGRDDFEDDRLHPKTRVLGVVRKGEARAYPLPVVAEEGVVNDAVAETPVVVATGPGRRLFGYDRRIGGRGLRFRPGAGRYVRADGSRWNVVTGRAVDGPHEGHRLRPATERPPMFWFSWLDFHPETSVYGV